MEIAEVKFEIINNTHIIFKASDIAYHSFINPDNSGISRPLTITIHLQVGPPDTSNLETVFDSGLSWSLYRDKNNYIISIYSPAFKSPFRVADVNHTFSEATIYCNEELIQQKDGKAVAINPVCYPIDQILLMHILAPRKGMIIHAAGAGIGGKGFVFPGVSGAGKSTLSYQFSGKKNITLLSDDRIVLRKIDDQFKAFGTPWPGEARVALNKHFPLEGIFFIHHSKEDVIKELKPAEAVKRLMPVSSIPWYDRKAVTDILSFCEDLVSNIPAYELHFKPGKGVADLLEDFTIK